MNNGNTGHGNTGYGNAGNFNTSQHNTGSYNSGICNTGHCNTGNFNSGSYNSGIRNSGSYNSGSYNSGNFNTGYCNSITPDECFIFNKPGSRKAWQQADKPKWMNVSLTKWIPSCFMSAKEKEKHPSYETAGGYLKCYPSLKDAYLAAWEAATEEDREKTTKLPNFDPDVFEEVFGFNPWKKHIIYIDGKEIALSEESFNELKRNLTM